MEIKQYEYKLNYTARDFFLDMAPPILGGGLDGWIAWRGLALIRTADTPLTRFLLSLLIAAASVFGVVFMLEAAEQIVSGSSRKVRIESCGNCFLVRFGCRTRFFCREDLMAFDFEPENRKLTFILRRCLEKRSGIFSYMRLFTGIGMRTGPEYLSPLVYGGLDYLKFGIANLTDGLIFPFSRLSLEQVRVIEIDASFSFSVPCGSADDAARIISKIIGSDASRYFRKL